MSNNPIQEVGKGNVHLCGNCLEDKGARTFIINGDTVVPLCPRCARVVISALRSAFPDEPQGPEGLPQFAKTMQRL